MKVGQVRDAEAVELGRQAGDGELELAQPRRPRFGEAPPDEGGA
jgi:hypothetical protein